MPSDLAVLDTELRHSGMDPKRVRVVTVGFDGGQALVAGRIAAFTGFIPDDGVALSVSGHAIKRLRSTATAARPTRGWWRLRHGR